MIRRARLSVISSSIWWRTRRGTMSVRRCSLNAVRCIAPMDPKSFEWSARRSLCKASPQSAPAGAMAICVPRPALSGRRTSGWATALHPYSRRRSPRAANASEESVTARRGPNRVSSRQEARQHERRIVPLWCRAWKSATSEPSRRRNVVASIGGIQMGVNGYGWHERKKPPTSDEVLAANRDWYLYTIDQFTPARCMFESNLPVDRLSCSYTVLWNQFKKLTNGFSAGDRSAMFHDTAMRVYRLPRH